MPTLSTQQRLDCLLKHIAGLEPRQGDGASLSAQDITLLQEQCGFKDRNEIGFYLKAMAERGLLINRSSGDYVILGAQITIDGYIELDRTLK